MPTSDFVVRDSWTRIESWLRRRARELYDDLKPPASDDQVCEFEQNLGVTLPQEVRQSFGIHDGTDDAGIFPSAQLDDMAYSPMSLSEIAEAHVAARKNGSLPANLLPLAGNGGGDYQCLDLSTGAIVEHLHETGEQSHIAASLAALLADLAEGLEHKRYRIDDENGIVRPDPAAPAKKQKLPKDSDLGLWEALRILDAHQGVFPAGAPWPIPPSPQLADALKRVDPDGKHFAKPPTSKLSAILKLRIHGAAEFFKYAEPCGVIELAGLRFYPIPQVIHLNKDHWVALPKKFPLVFALTVERGHKLCFDLTRNAETPPIVLYPAEFDLKGRTPKQLSAAGKPIAGNLIEFLNQVAAGRVDLNP